MGIDLPRRRTTAQPTPAHSQTTRPGRGKYLTCITTAPAQPRPRPDSLPLSGICLSSHHTLSLFLPHHHCRCHCHYSRLTLYALPPLTSLHFPPPRPFVAPTLNHLISSEHPSLSAHQTLSLTCFPANGVISSRQQRHDPTSIEPIRLSRPECKPRVVF